MNKLSIIGLLLVFILVISGCGPKCPKSCEDNNSCTQDKCSEETSFECNHEAITPCCGNDICESGEYSSCSDDCKNVGLEYFVVNIEDMPTGWEVSTRGERTSSDVSEVGKELGWKKGYFVEFVNKNVLGAKVYNYMSFYPQENIAKVIQDAKDMMGKTEDADDSTIDYEELSDPNLGDNSIAYKEITNYYTIGMEETRYCIEFTKLDIFELICAYDYNLVKDLAIKIESKI